VPYLRASEMMIHEEALYQVYLPLPLPPETITDQYEQDNTHSTSYILCCLHRLKTVMDSDTDGMIVNYLPRRRN